MNHREAEEFLELKNELNDSQHNLAFSLLFMLIFLVSTAGLGYFYHQRGIELQHHKDIIYHIIENTKQLN